MNSKYSLLMSKMDDSSGAIKDLEDDFHIACTKIPRAIGKEVQSIFSQEWNGEDGEDAYLPSKLCMKAFDWEVSMVASASTIRAARGNIDAFLDYLRGSDNKGCNLKIYSSYTGIGRQSIHFTTYNDENYWTDGDGMTVVQFKVKFRVCEPTTLILPNSASSPTALSVSTSTATTSGGGTATGHDISWVD